MSDNQTATAENQSEDTSPLQSARVTEIFMDSLSRENEDLNAQVVSEGIQVKVGFHPGRLESHKAEVLSMLNELSDDFKVSGGGGMSFLNACMDKHGRQWTGMHQVMDQLFMLGIAYGAVKPLMPRELWRSMPGGMPYYQVL